MHPVLRIQKGKVGVISRLLRFVFEAFKQRIRQFTRPHDGRQLAVVSNQDEPARPER